MSFFNEIKRKEEVTTIQARIEYAFPTHTLLVKIQDPYVTHII